MLRAANVSEIVQPKCRRDHLQAVIARLLPGLDDGWVEVPTHEVAVPNRAALMEGEDVAVRVPPDVLLEHLGQEAGDRDHPVAAPGLGCPDLELAADLSGALGHSDGPAQLAKLEVRDLEGAQLPGRLRGPSAGGRGTTLLALRTVSPG
jgi:hypothetical protein